MAQNVFTMSRIGKIVPPKWHLDRIATHILAAEGDSKWTFFADNCQEYEADKKIRLGEEGARTHRLRFKSLR
jgi:sulfate-transporting ATPase